jgi:hypothetical protein
LPPLYGIGGTALGGYEPLPVVEAPYLPPLEDDQHPYCLILDLDETLVHYYENGGEGRFNTRPGVDKFLTEMSEIYEIVIFTAAMQDVRLVNLSFSMLIGFLIKLIPRRESDIDCIDNMLCQMEWYLSK